MLRAFDNLLARDDNLFNLELASDFAPFLDVGGVQTTILTQARWYCLLGMVHVTVSFTHLTPLTLNCNAQSNFLELKHAQSFLLSLCRFFRKRS